MTYTKTNNKMRTLIPNVSITKLNINVLSTTYKEQWLSITIWNRMMQLFDICKKLTSNIMI